MTELRVIDGIKKEKPNYRRLYSNAYINTLKRAIRVADETKEFQFNDLSLDIRRKIVLYGVKSINATNLDILDYELLVGTFNTISMLNSMMGTFTPRELLTVFPIDKEYDGEKYEMKDYFYTRKFIEEFGMDRVIGEKMVEFHWDYRNREITRFAVKTMCVMSKIRRAEGGKGIMEEFMEEQGVPTYTLTEYGNGNQYLVNKQTGEMQKVIKPKPKHLKVIK